MALELIRSSGQVAPFNEDEVKTYQTMLRSRNFSNYDAVTSSQCHQNKNLGLTNP